MASHMLIPKVWKKMHVMLGMTSMPWSNTFYKDLSPRLTSYSKDFTECELVTATTGLVQEGHFSSINVNWPEENIIQDGL